MKTTLVIGGCLAAAILIGMVIMDVAEGQPGRLPTQQRVISYSSAEISLWNHARGPDGVEPNDTTPDPNGQTWDAYLDGTYLALSDRHEQYSLSFYAYGDANDDGNDLTNDLDGDPNTGTFDVNVYLVDTYSSWSRIGSFGATVGELELTHFPVEGTEINSGDLDPNESYKLADVFTTALSADIWTDANDIEGETNGWGRFNFKSHGAYGLVVLIDNEVNITTVFPIVKGR